MFKRRVLVHLSDGEVSVKLTGTRPEHAVRFPAAFAIISDEKTVYFEEAIALKESDKAECYEFVGNFLQDCPQEQLDCFFQAIFLRKDVLNVVGKRAKEVVFCANCWVYEDNRVFLSYRYIPDLTGRDQRIKTISEEKLYGESVHFLSGSFLNIQPDSLNMCSCYTYELKTVGLGFNDILNFFIKLLCQKGYDLTDAAGQEFCRQLVLKYCYVALDLEAEQEKLESKNGVLFVVKTPDSDEIELGEECFLAPEILFQPGFVGKEGKGVVEEISTIILPLQYPAPIDRDLIVCGMLAKKLRGFFQRLKKELNELISPPLNFFLSENLDKGAKKTKSGFLVLK